MVSGNTNVYASGRVYRAFVGEWWNAGEAADAATTRVEFVSGLEDAAYLTSMYVEEKLSYAHRLFEA